MGVVNELKELILAVGDATVEVAKGVKDYLDENHITPQSKDAYIKQLEVELAKTKQENIKLKRQLKKANWKK